MNIDTRLFWPNPLRFLDPLGLWRLSTSHRPSVFIILDVKVISKLIWHVFHDPHRFAAHLLPALYHDLLSDAGQAAQMLPALTISSALP